MEDVEILRGARDIVRNPAWRHVLAELRNTAIQEFESTQIGDDNARRSAWHMLDVVARLDTAMHHLSQKLDKSLRDTRNS